MPGTATAMSDRFLTAFSAIEKHLRKVVGSETRQSFSDMIRPAAQKASAVRRFEIDLREYGDLRNAIVHERRDGKAIAEPHDSTVFAIERIRDQLLSPPRVLPHFIKRVVSCSISDAVGNVAAQMLDGSFSQVPACDGAACVALLTAETVARWVAAQFKRHGGMLEDAPVSEVLEFTEDRENFAFVSREDTLFETLEQFRRFADRGKTLDAIIVSETGKRTEQPLGIITIYDVPTILKLTA